MGTWIFNPSEPCCAPATGNEIKRDFTLARAQFPAHGGLSFRDCGSCRCVPEVWKLTPLGGGVLFPDFSPEQVLDPDYLLLRRTTYRYGDTCSWSVRHPNNDLSPNEHWFLGRHGLNGWSVEYWDIADFGFEFGFVTTVSARYEGLLSDGPKYGIPIEELNRTSHFRCTGRNIFGPLFDGDVGQGFPDFVMVEPWYA